MKYQIEFCPNKDVVRIHVSQRLIQGSILSFDGFNLSGYKRKQFDQEAINKEGLIDFCKTVSELDGMEEDISFHRYNIQLSKASGIFSWGDLIPHILDALRIFVASDNILEEFAPPRRPTEAELIALREQGCDV